MHPSFQELANTRLQQDSNLGHQNIWEQILRLSFFHLFSLRLTSFPRKALHNDLQLIIFVYLSSSIQADAAFGLFFFSSLIMLGNCNNRKAKQWHFYQLGGFRLTL